MTLNENQSKKKIPKFRKNVGKQNFFDNFEKMSGNKNFSPKFSKNVGKQNFFRQFQKNVGKKIFFPKFGKNVEKQVFFFRQYRKNVKCRTTKKKVNKLECASPKGEEKPHFRRPH